MVRFIDLDKETTAEKTEQKLENCPKQMSQWNSNLL